MNVSDNIYKMPADWKKKWVDALRSDEFKQGRGNLCNNDGSMCCLGVLQHLYDIETYGESRIRKETDNVLREETSAFMGITARGLLNNRVLVYHSHPFIGEAGAKTLWVLNDIVGFSFKEIADVIEEQF